MMAFTDYNDKIVILEGPDGAGKTFFGERLRDQYGISMVHLTYYKDKEKHLKQFIDINDRINTNKPLIVDRYIISDKVYSSVYRNGNVIEGYNELLENMLNNENIILVFAIPNDKQQYLNEFEKLCNSREEMYSNSMDKVYDKYIEVYEELLKRNTKATIIRYDRFN